MRALYLFINGLASSNPERRVAGGSASFGGPDDELVPIRPGAFARWMAARDAASGPGGRVVPIGPVGRTRRARPTG